MAHLQPQQNNTFPIGKAVFYLGITAAVAGGGYYLYLQYKKNKTLKEIGEKPTNDAAKLHSLIYAYSPFDLFIVTPFIDQDQIKQISRTVTDWTNTILAYKNMYGDSLIKDLESAFSNNVSDFNEILDYIRAASRPKLRFNSDVFGYADSLLKTSKQRFYKNDTIQPTKIFPAYKNTAGIMIRPINYNNSILLYFKETDVTIIDI